MQADTCARSPEEDCVLEWKRALAAAQAIHETARDSEIGHPYGKFMAGQFSLHTQAIALQQEHLRFLSLGKSASACIKADRTGQAADALIRALQVLSSSVEAATIHQLQMPGVETAKLEMPDFGEGNEGDAGNGDRQVEENKDQGEHDEIKLVKILLSHDFAERALQRLGAQEISQIFVEKTEGFVSELNLRMGKMKDLCQDKQMGKEHHWWKLIAEGKEQDFDHIMEVANEALSNIDGDNLAAVIDSVEKAS